ncbi:hypothetical protein BHE74_00006170 [Ensete ventricosum]|nr:hypothetical protein BHE74_00006170 [Ensete ventricosum]
MMIGNCHRPKVENCKEEHSIPACFLSVLYTLLCSHGRRRAMREAATATALLLFSLEARRVKESGGGVLLASGSVDPEEGDEAWDVAGAANDNRSRGGQACNKAGASEAGRILNVRQTGNRQLSCDKFLRPSLLVILAGEGRRRRHEAEMGEGEHAAEVDEPPAESGGFGEKAVVVPVDEEAASCDAAEPTRVVAVLGPEHARQLAELLEAAAAGGLAVGDRAAEPPQLLRGDGRPGVVGREGGVHDGRHRGLGKRKGREEEGVGKGREGGGVGRYLMAVETPWRPAWWADVGQWPRAPPPRHRTVDLPSAVRQYLCTH